LNQPIAIFPATIIALLIPGMTAFGQGQHADSSYIRPFPKPNTIEVYTGMYNTSFNFRDNKQKENSYKLRVNSSSYIGADISYKWLYVQYAFNVPGTELDNNASFKYRQLNFRFGSRKLIFQPFYSSYNGLLIPEDRRRGFEPFQGIDFKNAGLETFYYFKPTCFSPKAAYAFSERQMQSCGTPFVSLTVMWNTINWKNPSPGLVNDPETYQLLTSKPQWISVIPKAGYAYNLSLKNWLIAPSVLVGMGLIRENANNTVAYRTIAGIESSLNAGYNGYNCYAYVGGLIRSESSRLLVKDMKSQHWVLNITYGHRFNTIVKKKRKPVNDIP
jgi:hypothetical protein